MSIAEYREVVGDVPAGALKKLEQPTDVESMDCSAGKKFIDDALGRYPSADFVARPTNACAVMFDDGRTLDILKIEGEWHQVKLAPYDGGS